MFKENFVNGCSAWGDTCEFVVVVFCKKICKINMVLSRVFNLREIPLTIKEFHGCKNLKLDQSILTKMKVR